MRIVLHGNCLRKVITVNFFSKGRKADTTGVGETTFVGGGGTILLGVGKPLPLAKKTH